MTSRYSAAITKMNHIQTEEHNTSPIKPKRIRKRDKAIKIWTTLICVNTASAVHPSSRRYSVGRESNGGRNSYVEEMETDHTREEEYDYDDDDVNIPYANPEDEAKPSLYLLSRIHTMFFKRLQSARVRINPAYSGSGKKFVVVPITVTADSISAFKSQSRFQHFNFHSQKLQVQDFRSPCNKDGDGGGGPEPDKQRWRESPVYVIKKSRSRIARAFEYHSNNDLH